MLLISTADLDDLGAPSASHRSVALRRREPFYSFGGVVQLFLLRLPLVRCSCRAEFAAQGRSGLFSCCVRRRSISRRGRGSRLVGRDAACGLKWSGVLLAGCIIVREKSKRSSCHHCGRISVVRTRRSHIGIDGQTECSEATTTKSRCLRASLVRQPTTSDASSKHAVVQIVLRS